ncbi:glycosyltransferase [Vibrio sp. ZF 223]|uniref:glycosyltransferase n=1 Tax=Vibrio sp. ZF 223 TaxID=2056191 RepID=UPI000D3D361C|nr:glycosyltransferase [Vibrio sp. ZF 223]PTQ02302.1 alpha-L-Rha alpha-1,3-L-rhamnosyltransferase [Vibrio sp. ZF 223]
MISVCMTTYNGGLFIEKQLKSILNQLSENDEVIICDDISSDNTVSVIESFYDERIKLYINSSRLGHVKNFEKSISLSKGDFIFLSDQDDVWSDNKVDVILDKFNNNPQVELIHHGIATIDVEDKIIDHHYIINDIKIGQYKLLNLTIKPSFFGCAMVFRRSLLKLAMPFPQIVYAHDHYLCNAALIKGQAISVPEVLIHYRQHDKNLTPKVSTVSIRSAINRIKLLTLNLCLIFRNRYVQK